ncbi:FAD-binding oxidoreductase [Halothiobacillus sp. DCM-1]|uniref:FAD-binding oxidoreductase n=1 Tax=Halothiobacillus sp. DCM-1 TaxID=3112558 RepID=UPI00324385F8
MTPSPTALDALWQTIAQQLPPERRSRTLATRWAYGMDNSRLHHAADIVAFPQSHEEVEYLVRAARDHKVPVTARGRGTGTAGGSVPLFGGLVIALDHMNQILEFRPEDRLIRVQAGLLNGDLQAAIRPAGFFWPPDPTSQAICTIGGNAGCNAGGPHAVKYGTTRDHILGLKAVMGTGETLRTGTQTTKGVVGYDLTRLMIGSEGTLGIITELTLKLTPCPEGTRLLRAYYRDMHAAAAAVSRLMRLPVTPSAIEFIDGGALSLMRQHQENDPALQIPPTAGALLLIELDGAEVGLDAELQSAQAAAEGDDSNFAPLDMRAARHEAEIRALWAARKALSPTLRHVAPKKINEDVVVPVSRMPALIARIDEIAHRHRIAIVNFGHAGNGNIHVNLLVNPDQPDELAAAESALSEVFETVLALDGTLSGEHGIGAVKRDYVRAELDPIALSIMHGIKSVFDPDGIMNPNKKIPD